MHPARTVGNLVARHSASCSAAQAPVEAATPMQEATVASTVSVPDGERTAQSFVLQKGQSNTSSTSTDDFRPKPLITKLMTFETSEELKETASKALERSLSDLEVKEVPHPVFANQFTLNLYCKNYAFAQSITNARGWNAIPQRLGLGGGNQAAKCMAFVEALKKSDKEPWYAHTYRAQSPVKCSHMLVFYPPQAHR